MTRKRPEELRSHRWVRRQRPAVLRPSFAHRADGLRARGLRRQAGHCRSFNTWSDITRATRISSNASRRVKRGVWEAGGFPVEIPR